jgi:hypothetical protein
MAIPMVPADTEIGEARDTSIARHVSAVQFGQIATTLLTESKTATMTTVGERMTCTATKLVGLEVSKRPIPRGFSAGLLRHANPLSMHANERPTPQYPFAAGGPAVRNAPLA